MPSTSWQISITPDYVHRFSCLLSRYPMVSVVQPQLNHYTLSCSAAGSPVPVSGYGWPLVSLWPRSPVESGGPCLSRPYHHDPRRWLRCCRCGQWKMTAERNSSLVCAWSSPVLGLIISYSVWTMNFIAVYKIICQSALVMLLHNKHIHNKVKHVKLAWLMITKRSQRICQGWKLTKLMTPMECPFRTMALQSQRGPVRPADYMTVHGCSVQDRLDADWAVLVARLQPMDKTKKANFLLHSFE